MRAYIIIEVTVTDHDRFEAYKKLTPDTLLPFGGKFISRGGAIETLEGDWSPKRVTVLEFPSAEKAKAWWSSEEYAEAKALRQSSATTKMIVVEGLA